MKDQLEALVKQMHESGILFSEGVREFKKRFILNVLKLCKGNQCRAARELGFHRNTLSRTIAELKLDVRQFRECPVPRRKTADVTERSQRVHVPYKPVQGVYAERCTCTGRAAHVLYGPSCIVERGQGKKAGA